MKKIAPSEKIEQELMEGIASSTRVKVFWGGSG